MKKHKLGRYILVCLVGFAGIIISFLWIFTVALFGVTYEKNKTKIAEKVTNSVNTYYNLGVYEDVLDILAYEENVCIDIVYKGKTIYTSNSVDRGCLSTRYNSVYKYKAEFETSGKAKEIFKVINPLLKNQTLVYATKIDDDTFSYVNVSIEPVESSVKVLKSVLLNITLIVIIVAVILSLYLSKRISSPIVKLNKKAKVLANSDFSNIKKDLNSNITELEELNDTLNYAGTELSRVDETRRDLLANVGHDLKTPLTMIQAYAELTKDLNSKDKKINNNMDIIVEESSRLNNLVNDILELSKLQSGMKNIEQTEFDITELINSIIKRYNIYEEKEKFNFVFDYKKELIIKADKQKIEQVIYNLINNAMNYTGEDKKVTIKIQEGVNSYRISIIDTGKGIDEEEKEIIWDKYYKNEKNHKRNKIGTGLGLSIVKEILINHRFKYGVNSKKGHGTEFYFDIPYSNVK